MKRLKKLPSIMLKHVGKLPSIKEITIWIILLLGIFTIILMLTGQTYILNDVLG